MIRRASIMDYEEIAMIYTDAYAHRFYGQLEFSADHLQARLLASLHYPHHTWVFETDGGKSVGFLKASQCLRYLDKLYVLPWYQGLGIGRALVGEYLKCAQESLSDDSTIWLEAGEYNTEALTLFKSMGYKPSHLERVSNVGDDRLLILELPIQSLSK